MARDIAARFNHHFGELFVLPEAEVDEKCAVLAGLDGRKMSKSYNNTVPLFVPEKKLRKLLMKIKTDSLPPEAPKDPANTESVQTASNSSASFSCKTICAPVKACMA